MLLGATQTLVTYNCVAGNQGHQFNSGGIVVLSARAISNGSNPNYDTIARNTPSVTTPRTWLGWQRRRCTVPGQPLPDVGPIGTGVTDLTRSIGARCGSAPGAGTR